MPVASAYLSTNNLHFKPISAHVGRGVVWSATSLGKKATTHDCQGRAVFYLSRAVLFTGAFLTIPIALIETIALSLIATVGFLINNFAYNNRSEFLQKHSLKCLSYAVHSISIPVTLFLVTLKNPDLRFHTLNALRDHGLHLGSAGCVQFFVGSLIDMRVDGRTPATTALRIVNLLKDSHPSLFNDILNQIQADFDLDLRERFNIPSLLEQHFTRYPADRQFVDTLDVQRLMNDDSYRQRAGELALRFLAGAQSFNDAVTQYTTRYPADRQFIETFEPQRLFNDSTYRQRFGECGQRFLETCRPRPGRRDPLISGPN